MMRPEKQARRDIIDHRAPISIDRSTHLIAAIKIEARTLLITGELNDRPRQSEHLARRALVANWPEFRNHCVLREKIERRGFYNLVNDHAATFATVIAARRARRVGS
ncbi:MULTISPECIES: hypothetical protein [unclassified Bradyrhizobium]|uniref:hypothetical protein n=1 Tax=unclassified Bradyrhizobium TaxID=2631580 RepID=UPI002916B4C5|nr:MULTISPECIES: hypothetical protein [unclassified Bradyrhizobium]